MSTNNTFQTAIKSKLVENGLFESQAEQVIELLKQKPEMTAFVDRWKDDVSSYPAATLAGVWLSARDAAVEWIDKNKPRHWARPMFAGGLPSDSAKPSEAAIPDRAVVESGPTPTGAQGIVEAIKAAFPGADRTAKLPKTSGTEHSRDVLRAETSLAIDPAAALVLAELERGGTLRHYYLQGGVAVHDSKGTPMNIHCSASVFSDLKAIAAIECTQPKAGGTYYERSKYSTYTLAKRARPLKAG